MKRKGVIAVALLLSLCLTACGSNGTDARVRTSRITKQTPNALKADDTNKLELSDGVIKFPESLRFASMESKDTDLTTYFVFNPKKSNEIADKRDGRKEGEYQLALEEAWNQAKAEAEKKSFTGLKSLLGISSTEPTEEDVFVFDTTAYTTAYNENTLMYIYEGVDKLSPQEHLTDSQIRMSIQTYVPNTIGANIELTNLSYDTNCMPLSKWQDNGVDGIPEMKDETSVPSDLLWQIDENLNGDYYVMSFAAYSGNNLASTYGDYCYPHTYYGIWLLEKNAVNGSIRKYYGFVFSNAGDGSCLTEVEYNNVFSQIKRQFGITTFSTDFNKNDYFYEAEKDYSKGRSYKQYCDLNNLTREYFTMTENKSVNIDSLTDEEVENNDAITVIDVSPTESVTEPVTESAESSSD